MMRLIKEWSGTGGSKLYLQDWCFDDGLKHLTILYTHIFPENNLEEQKIYFTDQLESDNSEVTRLIRNDFPPGCLKEIKKCVKDYFDDVTA